MIIIRVGKRKLRSKVHKKFLSYIPRKDRSEVTHAVFSLITKTNQKMDTKDC